MSQLLLIQPPELVSWIDHPAHGYRATARHRAFRRRPTPVVAGAASAPRMLGGLSLTRAGATTMDDVAWEKASKQCDGDKEGTKPKEDLKRPGA